MRARAAQFLGAVIATLPPEVVQAAQARAQTLDLWATVGEMLTGFSSDRAYAVTFPGSA